MFENVDLEKLANVLNITGQQGKQGFVQMLWKNQPAEVQTQLLPLLNAEARQVVEHASETSEPPELPKAF